VESEVLTTVTVDSIIFWNAVSLAGGLWALDPAGRGNHLQMSRAGAVLFSWLPSRWVKRCLRMV
jgi:hypothetical protein